MNNTKLLYIFLTLVAIWVILHFSSWGKKDRSFRAELVEIDTAAVDAISLFPRAEEGAEIRFTRTDEGWTVVHDGVTAEADNAAVDRLLGQLLTVKPERLAGKSETSWTEYQVTDSTGTRIQIEENGRITLDLILGRFSFQQATRLATTYVRLYNEDEVYAVDGFLNMSVNQGFSAWRNRTFVRVDPASLTRLTFNYPADSGFVLTQAPKGWQINGTRADSGAVASYLTALRALANDRFAEIPDAPPASPDLQLQIEGNNMTTVTVNAFAQPDGYLLHSSLNPNAYFTGGTDGVFNTLFKGSSHFSE